MLYVLDRGRSNFASIKINPITGNCKRDYTWKFMLLLKITAFWDVALCSLVEIGRRLRCAYCFHHQGYSAQLRMRVLNIRCRKNLKCHLVHLLLNSQVLEHKVKKVSAQWLVSSFIIHSTSYCKNFLGSFAVFCRRNMAFTLYGAIHISSMGLSSMNTRRRHIGCVVAQVCDLRFDRIIGI
jgi:hypothetical protein